MSFFLLSLIFFGTAGVAAMRSHWSEFSIFLMLAVFSTLGFVFRLLA